MTWKICSGVSSVCMLLLAAMSVSMGYCGGVLECGTSTVPMHCFYAYQATLGIGVVGTLIAIFGALSKSSEARRVAGACIVLLAILAVLILYVLIGVCANSSMSCNTNRIPTTVITVVGAVSAIIGMVRADDEANARPKAKI